MSHAGKPCLEMPLSAVPACILTSFMRVHVETQLALGAIKFGGCWSIGGGQIGKSRLNEFAESVAANADVVRAVAERGRMNEPSPFAPLGGFSHMH